jgi:Flp pilus assembly protein TadD
MQLFFRIIFKITLILAILIGCATTEEIKETDPVVLFNQGVALLQEGQYDRSINYFTKAIEINPRDAEVFIARGLFTSKLGQQDKACSDWKRACELGSCKLYESLKRVGACK